MATYDPKKLGGWMALSAGVFTLIGIATLAAFFAFEAKETTQGTTYFQLFGFLSDLIPILANLCALAVVVVLYRMQWAGAPQSSLIAAVAGITGNLILAIGNLLFVFDKITLEQQTSAFFIAVAPLGLWQILINAVGRKEHTFPTWLTTFGLVVGVCQLIHFVVFYLFDGVSVLFSGASLPLPLLIAVALSLIGYLGAPIWLICLGSLWLKGTHTETGSVTLHTPASLQG